MTNLHATESEIQSAILEYLRWIEHQGKCYCVRNNSFSGKITRPDGSVGYVKNAKKGTPDIICCLPKGRFVGFEVKADKKKQCDAQLEAEGRIKTAGGEYYVVRSLSEVEKIVEP